MFASPYFSSASAAAASAAKYVPRLDMSAVVFAVLVIVVVVATVFWFAVASKPKKTTDLESGGHTSSGGGAYPPDGGALLLPPAADVGPPPPGGSDRDRDRDGYPPAPAMFMLPGETTADVQKRSRFDLVGARTAIRPTSFPDALRAYETLLKLAWKTDPNQLNLIAGHIRKGLQHACHAVSGSAEEVVARLAADDFIVKLNAELRAAAKTRVGERFSTELPPWGTKSQWAPFAVTVPGMAAYYLLLPDMPHRQVAIGMILLLIDGPNRAIGADRDGLNSAKITAPYALAKVLNGDVSFAKEPAYRAVLEMLAMRTQIVPGANGYHADHSFIHNKGVPSVLVIEKFSGPLINYLFGFDRRMRYNNPLGKIQAMRAIVHHPTIPTHPMGAFGREENMLADTNPDSPPGLRVMPYIRYLRYFTPGFLFAVRGQAPFLAYFESEPNRFTQAQHWVQYRCVHDDKTSAELQYPDVGFVCAKADVASAITHEKSTAAYYPPAGAASFVLATDTVGVFWQTYRIDKLVEADIAELIVIDTVANTVTVRLQITGVPEQARAIVYCQGQAGPLADYRKTVSQVDVDRATEFTTVFDLGTAKVTTASTVAAVGAKLGALLPVTVDNVTVEKDKTGRSAILRVDSLARLACPIQQDYEQTSLAVPGVGRFAFDPSVNQYAIRETSEELKFANGNASDLV